MNRINDWEIMGPWEASFGGTLESATDFSAWMKDLHKKSIKELDIVGLHDTTTGEDRKFVAIDKVVQIIEAEMDEVFRSNHEYWLRLYRISKKILELKGEEEE